MQEDLTNRPLLSICITQYNENISALLRDIIQIHQNSNLTIQILCRDDHSETQCYAPSFRELMQIVEEHQDQPRLQIALDRNESNIGRSANRNLMANDARGKYLLFLDGDNRISSDDFIDKYLERELQGDSVYVGGTEYPERDQVNLHLAYGNKVESKKEFKKPYEAFKSNNFLMSRETFLKNRFNEELKDYGHEDTEFAYRLIQNGIRIRAINNPVIHNGVVCNSEFMAKQRQAIDSILSLEKSGRNNLTNLQAMVLKLQSNIGGRMLLKILRSFSGLHSFLGRKLEKSPMVDMLLQKSFCLPIKGLQLYKLLYYLDKKKAIPAQRN